MHGTSFTPHARLRWIWNPTLLTPIAWRRGLRSPATIKLSLLSMGRGPVWASPTPLPQRRGFSFSASSRRRRVLPAAAPACVPRLYHAFPDLRASLGLDVVSTAPPPLSYSTFLLQALEVLRRLEQVRPPSCTLPLCCVPVLHVCTVMRRLRLVRNVASTRSRRDFLPPPPMRSLRRRASC